VRSIGIVELHLELSEAGRDVAVRAVSRRGNSGGFSRLVAIEEHFAGRLHPIENRRRRQDSCRPKNFREQASAVQQQVNERACVAEALLEERLARLRLAL
jgi:hypothetical protein